MIDFKLFSGKARWRASGSVGGTPRFVAASYRPAPEEKVGYRPIPYHRACLRRSPRPSPSLCMAKANPTSASRDRMNRAGSAKSLLYFSSRRTTPAFRNTIKALKRRVSCIQNLRLVHPPTRVPQIARELAARLIPRWRLPRARRRVDRPRLRPSAGARQRCSGFSAGVAGGAHRFTVIPRARAFGFVRDGFTGTDGPETPSEYVVRRLSCVKDSFASDRRARKDMPHPLRGGSIRGFPLPAAAAARMRCSGKPKLRSQQGGRFQRFFRVRGKRDQHRLMLMFSTTIGA